MRGFSSRISRIFWESRAPDGHARQTAPRVNRLFQGGLIVDLILVFMAIETMGLLLIRIRGAAIFRPLDLLVNGGAGAALLLALRGALKGEEWQGVAPWLVLGLVFHLWDLRLRWSMHRTP